MKRHAFAMKIKEGMGGEYRARLGKIWNDLTEVLDMAGICNFSVWNVENILFGYCEKDSDYEIEAEEKEKLDTYDRFLGETYDWISTPWQSMRLMYHDFGIVRSNKEMIRHRVFITKLVPGSEEEYKRRHDALVDAREGKVDPGPDSNFSIWNAGGYIFGYNEIDTSMEHPMTEEEKESTIAWEKNMLGIMSWLTDDVDWITGEHHQHIVRVCYHE